MWVTVFALKINFIRAIEVAETVENVVAACIMVTDKPTLCKGEEQRSQFRLIQNIL